MRWFGHVEHKDDADCMKMEVDGSRQMGCLGKTWLSGVKEVMKSFDLFLEDAVLEQLKNECQLTTSKLMFICTVASKTVYIYVYYNQKLYCEDFVSFSSFFHPVLRHLE